MGDNQTIKQALRHIVEGKNDDISSHLSASLNACRAMCAIPLSQENEYVTSIEAKNTISGGICYCISPELGAVMRKAAEVDSPGEFGQVDRANGQVSGQHSQVRRQGRSGVGKSKLIHGATFEEETLFGALRSHLKPVYTDPDKAQDVTLSKVVTNPFGESETIEINATEISNSDMKLFVLDMPGMGDSNGCELDIVNGLNISSALRACASVRMVLVLSDLYLGDRMDSDTTIMKDCSRIAMDMVVSSEYVKHFSYVFTKMMREQALTISSIFDLSANRLSGDDVDICPLWAHIADKTKTKAMLANPMTDTTEDRMAMQGYIFKQAGTIAKPMAVFGDSVPRRSRDALKKQLELQRESVQKALEQGHLGFLKFKLDQLR